MSDHPPNQPRYPLVERVTSAVLGLVVLALAWILLAAYQPEWAEWLPMQMQVVIVLVLLSAALILVSLVALLHTRR